VPEPIEIQSAPTAAAGGHTCGCGGHDEEAPVLDVRTVPHAIRHAVVFGAFDSLPAGGELVIVAPHEPLPLLRQLADRAACRTETLVAGPEAWHVKITRLEAAAV
jgi:uncharacterized protein (DUF2249 family)